jgi:thioredoxin-dependent peroxiredoxin
MRILPALLLPLVLAFAAPVQAAEPELKKGDVAPDFSLQGSDGKTYKLSEMKGKTVVLAWFPKAYTGGCTMECKSLAENGNLLRAYDVQYFMISTDKPEDNAGFAKKENADFPILSDPTSETAKAYGVLGGYMGLPNRWTFYIGPDGKILDVDTKVSPKTSAEDMARKLGELNTPKK